jgi:predicted MFS family arabinose efflux permease
MSVFVFSVCAHYAKAALVPTLEAMKLAAPKTGPLAAEGAVRLFNVFQDLGQVAGPIAGGFAMQYVGFQHAAETLGAVSVFYAVCMLVYLSVAGAVQVESS